MHGCHTNTVLMTDHCWVPHPILSDTWSAVGLTRAKRSVYWFHLTEPWVDCVTGCRILDNLTTVSQLPSVRIQDFFDVLKSQSKAFFHFLAFHLRSWDRQTQVTLSTNSGGSASNYRKIPRIRPPPIFQPQNQYKAIFYILKKLIHTYKFFKFF